MSEVIEPEVIGSNALMSIEKAQVDMQVATAHQYPRSLARFTRDAIDMAIRDEEIAESCLYSRPVGGGKNAEGMSIRMAEIVGATYENLIVGARIIEQTDRYVVAQGVAWDMQRNYRTTSEVKESTVKADGTPYSERQSMLVAQVAQSKARRNAIFQVIPRSLCKPVETAVRGLLFGDGQSLDKRRALAVAWIGKLGIDPERVFKAIKVEGAEDIGAKQLETLTGLRNAIKEGDTTIDEAFPSLMSEDGTDILPKEKPAKPTEKKQADDAKPEQKGDGELAFLDSKK